MPFQKWEEIHVMLDIEMASIKTTRPVILEIGAIQFDIDTGKQLSKFTIIINFNSCLKHGLQQCEETMSWLRRNIPETLAKSQDQNQSFALPIALEKFTMWMKTLKGYNENSCKVWGNGAAGDNAWISSAYQACGKIRPWMFHGDMCVRTLEQEYERGTGQKIRKLVPFKIGKRHEALSDCSYQIEYLVAIRKLLWQPHLKVPRRTNDSILPTPPDSLRQITSSSFQASKESIGNKSKKRKLVD